MTFKQSLDITSLDDDHDGYVPVKDPDDENAMNDVCLFVMTLEDLLDLLSVIVDNVANDVAVSVTGITEIEDADEVNKNLFGKF